MGYVPPPPPPPLISGWPKPTKDWPAKPTIIRQQPIPTGGNCPGCASYEVSIEVTRYPLVADWTLEFNCCDCGYEFMLYGEDAEAAEKMLDSRQPTGPPDR